MRYVVFLFLLLVPSDVNACSCAGNRPPCQAFWEASAVFVGTVTNISTVEREGNYRFHSRKVRFVVEQKLRGIHTSEVDVFTGMGDSDCGYGFKTGGQYLVYAYAGEQQELATGICSRTGRLSEADEDMTFIRGLARAREGSVISGEVKHYKRSRSSGRGEPQSTAGVRVTIESATHRVTVTTDSNGSFNASGLVPGSYKVEIEPPKGLSIFNPVEEVNVVDRGCAVVTFYLAPDTRLTGKILDAQGQPASDVLVELVQLKTERGQAYPSSVKTNKDGRYEFKQVQPGSYHFGVRIAGLAGATYVPFPRTYHPGTSEASEATVVSINEGETIDLGNLILPSRLVEVTLKGVVIDAQSKPVKGATVWLKERQYNDRDMPYRTETDAEGRYSFNVYLGFKYNVNAYLDDPSGKSRIEASSEVTVTENMPDLVLTLTKPNK